MRGRSNSSSRRLALTISTSSTMNDFINKKLGVKKMEKFARKCSVTNEGMNDGYVYLDGDMYFKYEKDLIKHLRNQSEDNAKEFSDEFLLKESYELEEYYYTEWDDEDDYEYQMINGVLTEIQ